MIRFPVWRLIVRIKSEAGSASDSSAYNLCLDYNCPEAVRFICLQYSLRFLGIVAAGYGVCVYILYGHCAISF